MSKHPKDTMKIAVEKMIMDVASYATYDRASELERLATKALVEKLLQIKPVDRAPGGILTDAWSWDFIPQSAQAKALDRLLYKIGVSWGFDKESAIKLQGVRMMIDLSPHAKKVIKESYDKYRALCQHTFFVHGLLSYL